MKVFYFYINNNNNIIFYYFMQVIYNYLSETNHGSGIYNVAATL